jgi:hypothetical protein
MVQVDAPSQYVVTGSFQKIHPAVENRSSQPITYCVDFDQTSFKASFMQSTPTPFAIETEIRGKWQPLRSQPGVERLLRAVVLPPGQSKQYPFELIGGIGPVRLVLMYWVGSYPQLNCENPQASAFEARSQPIELISVEH